MKAGHACPNAVKHSPASLAVCRLAAVGATTVGFVFHGQLSVGVQEVWAWARQTAFVKHDTFEPLVASLSFGVWVALFRLMDRIPALRQWKMYPNQAEEENLKPPKHAIYSVTAYLLPLFVFDCFYPRRTLPEEAPTFGGLVGQLCAGIFVYDFLFFWVHIAMHRWSALRWVGHGKHHSKSPLEATQVVNHSLPDGAMQVVTNIVTLNLLQNHALARGLHNIMITYMLSETHSGYDMPWMLHNVVPFGILGGSPAHELHHKYGSAHFQQFFTYLDRGFGLDSRTKGNTSMQKNMVWGLACVGACFAMSAWRWHIHIGSRTEPAWNGSFAFSDYLPARPPGPAL